MTRPGDPWVFLESTPLVPIEVELDGTVRYVGPQARELLGYEPPAWEEDGFWSRVVVPDDQENLHNARRNSAQAQGRHEIDYRAERSDGRIVWVAEILSWVEGDDGPVLRGHLWDVSGRKRQEVTLWKNEERIRALIRRAPDALILTDGEGRVLNMNDQAEALFDYSLGEIAGSGIEHLVPESLRPRLAKLRQAFSRDPHRRSLVEGNAFSIQRSDGSEIPVELSLSRVSGEDEEDRILWSARDLTVRRRVEAQRRAEVREGGSVRPMVCVVDVDDRILDADAPFLAWFDESASGLQGRELVDVMGRRLVGELRDAIRQAREGAAASRRTELRRGDGKPAAVEIGVAPRHGADGAVSGYWMVILPV